MDLSLNPLLPVFYNVFFERQIRLFEYARRG